MSEKSQVSRRSFVKGSLLAGLGLAGAAGMASLVGCEKEEKSSSGGGGQATLSTKDGHNYAVHEADVIVVGGGMAGLNAARMAYQTGASVIMVDKGPVGKSGNSGLHWGQTFVTSENVDDDGVTGANFLAVDTMGIMDQEQARNVSIAHAKGQPRSAIEMSGCVLQREDSGNVVGVDDEQVTVTHTTLYRQAAQEVVHMGIPVYDNTMMLDILEDEGGNAAGIIAMNQKDGSAHVFRGKKTILCTGGYHWCAGGHSSGSPESTGEGHYALLKRGFAFKDMEFPQYDFTAAKPYGMRLDEEKDQVDIAVCFPVNGEINHRMCNKDKRPFTKYFFEDPKNRSIANFQGALITAAKEIYAGNGIKVGEDTDGILFDLRDFESEPSTQSYATYKGFKKFTEETLGHEFPDYVEVVANEYSSAGVPFQDPETCESEIPGLYTVFVALSAMSSMWNWGQAYLAGIDAATKALETKEIPAFSPDDVNETLNKAYGYLENESSNGIRSADVHRKIQRAFYRGQGYMKNGDKIQEMIDELERIRTEDLPNMVCEDKSLIFNRDWRMAMEAEGMIACSLATTYAAAERKESRSPFFRDDYPKMNNEEYLCYLWVSMDDNWNFKVEKKDIVDTVISKEELMKVLDDQDPKFDISVPNEYLD